MTRLCLAAVVAPGLVLALLASPVATHAQSSDTLEIHPDALTLLVGETQQLSLAGTVFAPLVWASTDPEIMLVTSNGVVEAVAPGRARILVSDALGHEGVSAVFTVAHLELKIGDVTVPNSQAPFTIWVSGDLGPWQVQALEFTLIFDPAVLQAVGASATGTMSAAWGAPVAGLAEDRIRVAHAGVSPLSGSGVLVGIVLRVRPGVTAGTSTVLAMDAIRLNEGSPLAKGGTATIKVRGVPVVVRSVTVAPAAAQLRPNTLVAFTATVVSNGNGGVAWSIPGAPGNGTINEVGVYRAPAVLPSPPVATIVATSLEDAAVVGRAVVTLLPAQGAGLVSLVVLENPANRRGLQLMVSAAGAFLAPPTVTVNGQAVSVTPADGSMAVYRGHICVSQATAAVTVHAAGSTAHGAGEAEAVIAF